MSSSTKPMTRLRSVAGQSISPQYGGLIPGADTYLAEARPIRGK